MMVVSGQKRQRGEGAHIHGRRRHTNRCSRVSRCKVLRDGSVGGEQVLERGATRRDTPDSGGGRIEEENEKIQKIG